MRYAAISRVSTNAFMLLLGTMVRMVVAFAFIVYAARYLGVAGYGKFALTQQLYDLCTSLCATGFCILVTRETAKEIRWLRRNLLSVVLLIVILSCGAAGLLAVIARYAGYAPDTRMAIYIASAAILPAALCTVAESIFVALQKAEIVAAGVATEAVVRIALWFGVLMSGYGLYGLFIVLIATRWAQLAFYAVLLTRRLPTIYWRIRFRRLWFIASAWRIFAAETCIATIYVSMDVVLLSLFCGEAAVGIYDAAWKLIRLGPVVASSFTTAVFPYISRLYVDSRDAFHQVSEQSVKFILAAILPAVLCISIFADQIVLFLFHTQYAESGPILRLLAWLLIPQFLNPFLSRVLYARGQQGRSLVVSVVGLTTFLSIAFYLIPNFAARGAAWTTMISYYAALACYIAYATVGTNRRSIVIILVRQTAAAVVLCLGLMLMKHTQMLTLLAASAVLYAAMLVVLRIVTLNDFKLLKQLPAIDNA